MNIRMTVLMLIGSVWAFAFAPNAAASSVLAAGVYSFGYELVSGFENSSCPNALSGYGDQGNDAKFYFAGMGKAGSRIDFAAWLYPKPYVATNPPLPYGPGIIEILLPKAPASDISLWAGEATVVYHLIPGIYDYSVNPAQIYSKPVFLKQALEFSFTYSSITSFTGLASLALKFSDGCNFYVASFPGNTFNPPYILQRVSP